MPTPTQQDAADLVGAINTLNTFKFDAKKIGSMGLLPGLMTYIGLKQAGQNDTIAIGFGLFQALTTTGALMTKQPKKPVKKMPK